VSEHFSILKVDDSSQASGNRIYRLDAHCIVIMTWLLAANLAAKIPNLTLCLLSSSLLLRWVYWGSVPPCVGIHKFQIKHKSEPISYTLGLFSSGPPILKCRFPMFSLANNSQATLHWFSEIFCTSSFCLRPFFICSFLVFLLFVSWRYSIRR
jgi:hypothetical protein